MKTKFDQLAYVCQIIYYSFIQEKNCQTAYSLKLPVIISIFSAPNIWKNYSHCKLIYPEPIYYDKNQNIYFFENRINAKTAENGMNKFVICGWALYASSCSLRCRRHYLNLYKKWFRFQSYYFGVNILFANLLNKLLIGE